ncbi:MAG: beta-N-acetylhexosaminidase [Gemmatimonadota bacterium]|nr:beta-N-acetylhexosaminidase [Gemmatimonadota bacterium]
MRQLLFLGAFALGFAQITAAQTPDRAGRKQLTLMPMPATVAPHDGRLTIDSTFRVAIIRHADTRLVGAVSRMIPRLEYRTGIPMSHVLSRESAGATLVIDCDGAGEPVQGIDENESYTIESSRSRITLHAATTVGVIRGLETVLQLVDGDASHYFIPSVSISDTPRFRWRGLLIDVSRHFEPVAAVERTLDGMAAVKLNVLHWHLSDDQGIRVESRRFPRLQGAGSDSLYYTQAEIRAVVAYARDRGIRVVPEFDMPGHATAWFVGYPQYASGPGPYSVGRHWSGYPGVFDPTRASVYRFIDSFIGEMASLFPDAYWHIGGDEVDATQWKENARIQKFMTTHSLGDNAALQAYFNRRLSAILTRHHRRMIGWDEILHPELPRTTVVQSWRGTKYLAQAASQGFNGILSAPYYLDAMRSAEYHYLEDPLGGDSTLTPEQSARVLGGEACMWAELVSDGSIDSRIWPRLAAIAERFWSPRSVRDVGDMYRRLAIQDVRLEQLGLRDESHTDRFLRRTVNGPDVAALAQLLRFAEPVTLGQRVRGGPTSQVTPLVQIADAARPDPPARWGIEQLSNDAVSESASAAAARDTLRAWFGAWRGLPARVRLAANASPLVEGAIPAADALSGAAVIGITVLDARKRGVPLTKSWSDSANAALQTADRPQGLLHLVVVPAIRRLLNGEIKP